MTDTAAPPVATPTHPTDPHVAATRWWHDPWRVASVIAALVLVGIAIWPLHAVGRAALDLRWNPSGDWAVLTMRVEDVGRTTPLVGPYSRFGWSHPGPLSYWLLAGPYHWFGATATAVLAAAALLNSITIAAIGAIAWRRGRLPLVAITMAAIAMLLHAMGPEMIRDPWNPYLTLLPLALFVFVMWSVAEGDHALWPLAAFVASVEFQSHLGYLPMLVTVLVVASVMAWRRRAQAPLLPTSRSARWWLLGGSITIIVACWAPVIWDQIAGTGNLGAIARYWLDGSGSTAGLGDAVHQAALHLAVPGAPWLGQKELAGPDGALIGASITALLVPIVAMAGSIWIARRRGANGAVRLAILVVATAIAGVFATAEVVGPLYDWITRWWWVVGCLWWMSIAWSLWCAARTTIRSVEFHRAAITALTAVALIIALRAVRPIVDVAATAPAPNPSASEVLRNFLPATIDALDGSGPVMVRAVGSMDGSYSDAVRFALEHEGVQVVSPAETAFKVGEHRSIDHRTPVATVWIVSADLIAEFESDPSMHLVGSWDPMTPAERSQWARDETELQSQFLAADRADLAEALTNGTGGVDREGASVDGVDRELLARVEAGRRRGDPVAVFIGPPPT